MFQSRYRSLLRNGVYLNETDLPVEVSKLLYREEVIPVSKLPFFER